MEPKQKQYPIVNVMVIEARSDAVKSILHRNLECQVHQFRSVQSLSHAQLFATAWIAAHQASLSITKSWSSDSRPSSQWCHPAISSSVVPFSSCPQSLPASESFPMSQLFAWGGQSTGVYCFCFGSIPSFFLELFLHWSPVAYWAPTDLRSSSFSILSFCLFILFK